MHDQTKIGPLRVVQILYHECEKVKKEFISAKTSVKTEVL